MNRLTPKAYPTAPLTVGPERDMYPPQLEIDGRLRLIEQHLGVLTTHQETFDRYQQIVITAANGLAAGAVLLDEITFDDDLHAKSFVIDNNTGYVLGLPALNRYVPANTFAYVVQAFPAVNKLKVIVVSGTQSAPNFIRIVGTERLLESGPAAQAAAGGGSAVSIADGSDVAQGSTIDVAWTVGAGTVIALLKNLATKLAGTIAENLTQLAGTAVDVNSGVKSNGTMRVVLATDQPALTAALKVDPSAVTSPVSLAALPALVAGSALVGAVSTRGAANLATSQVTTGVAAATLAIARATRRRCLIKNLDAAITVTVGAATVTAANGTPLKPGESMEDYSIGLIQAIAASGTPILSIWDEFD